MYFVRNTLLSGGFLHKKGSSLAWPSMRTGEVKSRVDDIQNVNRER